MNNADICEMVMTSDKVSMALPCFLTQRNSAHKGSILHSLFTLVYQYCHNKNGTYISSNFRLPSTYVNYRTVSIVDVMDHRRSVLQRRPDYHYNFSVGWNLMLYNRDTVKKMFRSSKSYMDKVLPGYDWKH